MDKWTIVTQETFYITAKRQDLCVKKNIQTWELVLTKPSVLLK